jgi:hypothetical protein
MEVLKHNLMGIVSGVLMVFLTFSGCNPKRGEDKKPESIALEAEESGSQITLEQVYDEVISGSRLVLAYNKESHVFTGTVENVSDQVLKRVRVEVHLSNGSELGPATQLDLQPGEKRLILLEAGSGDFTTWSAHAEIESGEHGHEHN